MAIAKRLVLSSGFGIIIALLVISTALAWRIQETFSERSVEIHRRFVHEQELLTNMRRVLWSVGMLLRDHYLNPHPESGALQSRLEEAKKQAESMTSELRRSSTRSEAIDELDRQFSELWRLAYQGSDTPMSSEERFTFLQQEIVPRRDSAGRVLREIERANTSLLAESEEQFTDTRTGATRRLLIILGVCLVAGLYVAGFSTRYAERLEQESQMRFTEVSEAKQQLEHLSARLMDVQEEERTRLSRELHDEIIQNLAVLKMEITQAQAAAAKGLASEEGLARARQLAETTVRSVRDISLLLRPSLLDDLGLIPALQWQAEEFSRRTGVPCTIVGDLPTESLPETSKTCVYRVVQEALRNCEKHSGATEVRVNVLESDNNLQVSIEDNGRGFQENGTRRFSSLGVLGMRERAAALGGTLQTGNRVTGGAVVRLTLPLQSISEHDRFIGVHA
jgi:signal transduction histidine kinase